MSSWHSVAKVSEVREGRGVAVKVPGRRKPVAVFMSEGKYYAIVDECSHAYAPLSVGEVKECVLTCPWHGAQFDVRTGKGIGDLAYPEIRTFPVRVEGDDIQVDVD